MTRCPWKRAACLLLALCLFLLLLPGGTALAARKKAGLVRLYVDGLFGGIGLYTDACLYLPLEDVCGFFGYDITITLSEEEDEKSYLAFCDAFTMEETTGPHYTEVNNRYLYTPGEFLVVEDVLYVCSDALAGLFHVTVNLSEDHTRADLDSSSFQLLTGSSTFYVDTYGYDTVFWLSHIIYAEAGHEIVENRIGVGNVILNRVADSRWPDTVYDVVFDTDFCVQFTPILYGGVYAEPDELSMVAAYLALDGFNTVGDCLYFVDPYAAPNIQDFEDGHLFVVQWGDHRFYASYTKDDGTPSDSAQKTH